MRVGVGRGLGENLAPAAVAVAADSLAWGAFPCHPSFGLKRGRSLRFPHLLFPQPPVSLKELWGAWGSCFYRQGPAKPSGTPPGELGLGSDLFSRRENRI